MHSDPHPHNDPQRSVFHVETPPPEYSLQTPNNSPIASAIPETQKIINKSIFIHQSSITRSITIPSPEGNFQVSSYSPLAPPASEHILSHLQLPTVLENEIFLDNMEKNFLNLKTISPI